MRHMKSELGALRDLRGRLTSIDRATRLVVQGMEHRVRRRGTHGPSGCFPPVPAPVRLRCREIGREKRAQSPRARNRQAAFSARAEDTVAGVRRLDDGRGFVNVRMTENRKRAGSCSVHGAYDASGNADADGRDRSAEEMRPGCTVHASTGRVRRVQVVVKGAKGTGTVNVASFRR